MTSIHGPIAYDTTTGKVWAHDHHTWALVEVTDAHVLAEALRHVGIDEAAEFLAAVIWGTPQPVCLTYGRFLPPAP